MSPMSARASSVLAYHEVPIEKWAVRIRTSAHRDARRYPPGGGLLSAIAKRAREQHEQRVMARWLGHQLRHKLGTSVAIVLESMLITSAESIIEPQHRRVLQATIRLAPIPEGAIGRKALLPADIGPVARFVVQR